MLHSRPRRRSYRTLGWIFVAVCLSLLMLTVIQARQPIETSTVRRTSGQLPAPAGTGDAVQWFRRVKPYCNAVEVTTLEQRDPPPPGLEGSGYHAACLGLAGRIDDARRVIDALPAPDRGPAAGIVFDVGHPVADAGDDRSAGPIMELVIDYVPSHYMALYHAGMAEYMLGQRALARRNLSAFLDLYRENDGWRTNALDVIRRIDSGVDADLRRPREPGR